MKRNDSRNAPSPIPAKNVGFQLGDSMKSPTTTTAANESSSSSSSSAGLQQRTPKGTKLRESINSPLETPSSARTRKRPPQQQQQLMRVSLFRIWLSMVGTLAAMYTLYWVYYYNLPYCDSAEALSSVDRKRDTALSAWMPALSCQTCPVHGTCENGVVKCPLGYLPPYFGTGSCRVNKEFLRQKEYVLVETSSLLAEGMGEYECGYPTGFGNRTEQELHDALLPRMKSVNNEEFEEFFRSMVKECKDGKLKDDYGIAMKGKDKFVSTQPTLPWRCRLQRSVSSFLKENIYWISGALVSTVAVSALHLHYKTRLNRRNRVRTVTEKIRRILMEHSRKSPDAPYLAVSHVRATFFSAMEKISAEDNWVWDQVAQNIQRDTRVRTMEQDVKGEPLKCWEWTGPQILQDDYR